MFIFFFFKQKTAYEMQRGLVGSEMCIRDRIYCMLRFGIFHCDCLNNEALSVRVAPYSWIVGQIHFSERIGATLPFQGVCIHRSKFPMYSALIPVSYTHLTLPTILLVQISVVAVSLKKKKKQRTNCTMNKKKDEQCIIRYSKQVEATNIQH
eukprot:TRINITY_DN13661_c0_g2_i1.p2 TRINITY_DN13661_c0_g2~~TRINITY_DN13661_c0_g2_i1.p2  ORF type:complete len:152 (-),score=29.32 TRINITY_DN13661_c0_g2_i1:5-460(-)